MFLGYVFIALCESVLDEKEYSLGELSGANAKRAMLVLLKKKKEILHVYETCTGSQYRIHLGVPPGMPPKGALAAALHARSTRPEPMQYSFYIQDVSGSS